MAMNKRTLRLRHGLKIKLGHVVDAHTRDLIAAWSRAWDDLAAEWETALNDLAAQSKNGKWPSRRTVNRSERVRQALKHTQSKLDELAKLSGGGLTVSAATVTELGAASTAALIASQMPPKTLAAVDVTWNRVNKNALDKIVARTTKQITALHKPLSKDATAAMKRHLIRGVAVGENPNKAARQMLKRVQGDFNGGLTRAKTIARTEMLDAYRSAEREQRKANTDVLKGWMWISELSSRTCMSCLCMHGTEYPPGEDGPLDHQQGRCTAAPITKSWRDLGFDIDEPEPLEMNARQWFDDQPQDVQVKMMGQTKLDALNNGDIEWSDLAAKKSTDGWRDSYQPASLKDLGLSPKSP